LLDGRRPLVVLQPEGRGTKMLHAKVRGVGTRTRSHWTDAEAASMFGHAALESSSGGQVAGAAGALHPGSGDIAFASSHRREAGRAQNSRISSGTGGSRAISQRSKNRVVHAASAVAADPSLGARGNLQSRGRMDALFSGTGGAGRRPHSKGVDHRLSSGDKPGSEEFVPAFMTGGRMRMAQSPHDVGV